MKEITGQFKTDVDYKLLILYIIDTVGELSKSEIVAITNEEEFGTYINIALALDELEKNKEIVINDIYYCLTQKGWEALNLFEERIPNSVRRTIALNASAYRKNVLKNRNCAVWFKEEEKTLKVYMQLQQFELMQLRLEYTCSLDEIPFNIGKGFVENAKEIYEKVLYISIRQDIDKNIISNLETSVFVETDSKKICYAVGILKKNSNKWKVKLGLPTLEKTEIFIQQWRYNAPMLIEYFEKILLI